MRHHRRRGVDHQLMRDMNEIAVLSAIIDGGMVSRRDIAESTRLTDSTVSHVTRSLLSQGLLEEVDVPQERRGRPERLLLLRPQAARLASLAIDVGRYELGLVDLAGRLDDHARFSFSADASPEAVLTEMEHRLGDLLAAQREPVWGLGVSVPGMVSDHGVLLNAPNLGWIDVPLADRFGEALDVPVMVANEADASALGEYYFGAGKGSALLLYLSLGIGIGCGIVMEGHLFSGVSGAAGEVGHTTLMPDGPPCSCGRRGCFETFASTRALTQSHPGKSVEEIIELARRGEHWALQAVHNVADYVGQAVVNLVNVFDPDVVILGGPLAAAENYLLWPVERRVENEARSRGVHPVHVKVSTFGDNAPIIGSGAFVLEQVLAEAGHRRRAAKKPAPATP